MDQVLHDITQSLLDCDGSCRDINFEAPTWEGAISLIRLLEEQFAVACIGASTHAETSDALSALSNVRCNGGFAQVIFREGRGFLQELQLFVSKENDECPFIELTFFPRDVLPSPSLSAAFVDWLGKSRVAVGSPRGFARYEHASWTFGDTSINSGVFLVSAG